MRVLVADKLEKSALDGLGALGCDVVSMPDLVDEPLVEAIRDVNPVVLVVRGTKVPQQAIAAGADLALVIRAGAGYNTIDVQAATDRGIKVANCPGKNAIAVAELAFGLILALDRHIPDCVASLRQGVWNKKAFSKASGLYGAKIGLVGMGSIGQEMVSRAQAFGMDVHVYSSYLLPEAAADMKVTLCPSLDEVASTCDIVSVHSSLRPETKGMIGKAFFDLMKPGALFINTSRSEVVDGEAMLEAARSGKIRCGLDVFDGEPVLPECAYDGPYKDVPGVYCTHHIGAGTNQAQEAVADEVVRIVAEFQSTGHAPNVVN